jgi:hypothetical protein
MATTVPITVIQGSDNVGLSRLTINSNFASLQNVVNGIAALLDPNALTLSGVSSISVGASASNLATPVLSVANAATILGNTIFGTVGASTSTTINGSGGVSISQSSVTLGVGSLSLSSSSAVLSSAGPVSFSNEYRQPGIAAAIASPTSLVSGANSLNPVGKYYIAVRNTISSVTTANITLQAGSANGQKIEIYNLTGASGSNVTISTANFVGLTGGIRMTASGDKVVCTYDSGAWYLTDYASGDVIGQSNTISATRTN